MKYKRIREYLIDINNKELVKVSNSGVEDLLKEYENIDKDYLIFINEIGVGNIDNRLDIKGYLFNFQDIGLEDIYSIPDYIMFFADNFSGDFIGFDLTNNQVIEFWHDSQKVYHTGKSFCEYIKYMILI